MSIRIKQEILSISYIFVFFILLSFSGMIIFEFIFAQLIGWILVDANYKLPTIDQLLRWGDFFILVAPGGTIIVWIFLKVTYGR
ncbi:hypothetical protein [Rugamonas sp. DEMB1]|uniref:hypothetical protein n=1 Tax=Rugamonas sp. DEMB1 TaxID=3039386 RepID=UPI002449E5E7|nr:hypothetical protein [Rugamonas sp. DEMB1]WGG52762.1 hypothetical protein QC826_11820 [Rugamonas sp. DEMB1]